MEKRVVILTTQCGDWEGLFVDGDLIDEGHHLGEGDRNFMLKQAEKYDFKSSDILRCEINDTDEEMMSMSGNFPITLAGLNGIYNIK